MKIKINQVKYILIISILFLYVFRGAASKFRIANLSYALTALLVIICFVTISKRYRIPNAVFIYFIAGILSLITTFFSLEHYGVLAGSIGFAAANMNLILWLLFYESLETERIQIFIYQYIKVIIIFAIISAILGIYQTFIDPSLKGFATNEIYSNAELLSTGQYVRRATALFGSAQNYGVFEGIAFCMLFYTENKKTIFWFMGLAILGMGVLVSGSRSASVCVVITLFFSVIYVLKKSKIQKRQILFLAFLLIPFSFCIIKAAPHILNARTLGRLTDFSIAPAAAEAYKKAVVGSGIKEFFLGRGFGFSSWTTHQFLGERIYKAAYGTAYYSVESFFMHTLAQGGSLGMFASLFFMLSTMWIAWKSNNRCIFLVNFCLFVNQIFTPSFTGLAISFIFWPLVLYPLIQRNRENCKNNF
ncbi:MAG: hypothetical protein HFI23_12650 [Lachnospiraceae bacterium]|nr:hypothetical protein [Lachnospiraceae bacterium]